MAAVEPVIRIQRDDFDIAAEIERIRREGGADLGAVVSFTGICRDESGRLAALQLEHYPDMAQSEIAAIAREAASRWPLSAITVIHRHGRIAPGKNIVLVVTAGSHRHAAFMGAQFLMDYLKSRAPFWKKEIPADGSEGEWVGATEGDERARQKWLEKEK